MKTKEKVIDKTKTGDRTQVISILESTRENNFKKILLLLRSKCLCPPNFSVEILAPIVMLKVEFLLGTQVKRAKPSKTGLVLL